jgi:hypothetical protein
VTGPPGTMDEGLLGCEIVSIALLKSCAIYCSSKDGPKRPFSTGCVNRALILSLIFQMLLDRFTRLGYSIFIQGDADGSTHDIFQAIVAQGAVNEDRTFIFRHDFETSVPLALLLKALQQLGELIDESLDAFKTKVAGEGPVDVRLKKTYRLELEPLKMALASQIADILNQTPGWWQDERFLGTELGRFLKFIWRVF